MRTHVCKRGVNVAIKFLIIVTFFESRVWYADQLNQIEVGKRVGNAIFAVVIGLVVGDCGNLGIGVSHGDAGIGGLQERNVIVAVTKRIGRHTAQGRLIQQNRHATAF